MNNIQIMKLIHLFKNINNFYVKQIIIFLILNQK